MTIASKDLLYGGNISRCSASDIIKMMSEIMELRKINGINDNSIPEHVTDYHREFMREYYILHDYLDINNQRNLEWDNMRECCNREYADIIDDVVFMCPEHEREFYFHGSFHAISRKDRDLILDGKAFTFTVNNVNENYLERNVFIFNENGDIKLIKGTMTDKQIAAAKVLWEKIKEKKGMN
jgi:hypothetical protein